MSVVRELGTDPSHRPGAGARGVLSVYATQDGGGPALWDGRLGLLAVTQGVRPFGAAGPHVKYTDTNEH